MDTLLIRLQAMASVLDLRDILTALACKPPLQPALQQALEDAVVRTLNSRPKAAVAHARFVRQVAHALFAAGAAQDAMATVLAACAARDPGQERDRALVHTLRVWIPLVAHAFAACHYGVCLDLLAADWLLPRGYLPSALCASVLHHLRTQPPCCA